VRIEVSLFKKHASFCGVLRKSLGKSQESSPAIVSENYLPEGFRPRIFSNFPPQPYTPFAAENRPLLRHRLDNNIMKVKISQTITGIFLKIFAYFTKFFQKQKEKPNGVTVRFFYDLTKII
jgi:hypothetical protein